MALSNAEKHAIENMISKGFTKEDILSELPETKKVVATKYIKRIEQQQAENVEATATPSPSYDRGALLSKLSKAGIHGKDAERLIAKALPNVSSNPALNEIYNEVIRNIGPRELMTRESESGRRVTIMTEAASAKGEKSGPTRQPETYVFKPETK